MWRVGCQANFDFCDRRGYRSWYIVVEENRYSCAALDGYMIVLSLVNVKRHSNSASYLTPRTQKHGVCADAYVPTKVAISN
ncbi:hypothetical protein BDR06DRAFT_659132 [Suillus hirtellus]|nr:hypothetical protein BDR06DRAFT_659132 [Suillus hirtellus]